MTYKCPQCGKPLNVSLEELARNGCHIVCPQCLADFEPTGIDHQAIATLQASKNAAVIGDDDVPRHCHHCGHSLPATGLRYCPYCGKSLDFNAVAEPTAVTVRPTQPTATPLPQTPVTPSATASAAEEQPTTRPPLYMPFRPTETEQAASPTFRGVCYAVIALLVAAWLVMIYLSSV